MLKNLATVLLILTTLPAHGFGRDGHEITGEIAARLIVGTRAEREVAKLLKPGETLPSITIWLDCAKGPRYCSATPTTEMRAFANRFPMHHHFHYADEPFEADGYRDGDVGTGNDDVVHVLTEAIETLRGSAPLGAGPHGFTHREALLLIAHLMGDIHQPLHVGAAYLDASDHYTIPVSGAAGDPSTALPTQGGNWLHMGHHNLHGYWDTDLVKRAMRYEHARTPSAMVDLLLTRWPADTSLDVTSPSVWASESVHQAGVIFSEVSVDGESMMADPNGHSHREWQVSVPARVASGWRRDIERQLAHAGERLAAVLLATWP